MQRGHVYQVGNCWMLKYRERVTVDGRVVNRRRAVALTVKGKRTQEDAQEAADEFLKKINDRAGEPAESGDTVLHFLEKVYLPNCWATLRPSTANGYANLFRLVKPHLENARWRCLKDFTTGEATKLLAAVAAEKQRAHTTHRNLKQFLSGAFKFAEQNDARSKKNPVTNAKLPRGKASSDTHACTLDEVKAMLAVLDEPARTLVLTAAMTGLRLSEIKGLRWEDFRDNELTVSRAVWCGHVNETKTLSSNETIPVLSVVTSALEAHKARNSGDGYVFHGVTGKPLMIENVVRRDIRPALEKAGLTWWGWHAFRRGLATNLYHAGASLKTAQAILRHSNADVTMEYYVKPVAAESKKAMESIERDFRKGDRKKFT